jgi:hypothetical protein
MEDHPTIQRGRSLLATAAGLDPHRVRDSFDRVSETDFLVNEEPRKTKAMSLMLGLLLLILGCSFPLHDTFLSESIA